MTTIPSPDRALRAASARTWRKLLVSLSHGGLRSTLYWAAFGYLRRHRFCVYRLDPRAVDPSSLIPSAHYDVWEAARLREWRRGREGLPVEAYQDEIDGAGACSVALVGGDLAGLIWIYREGGASRLFRLGPGEAELNFGTVVRRHRHQGHFRSVLVMAAAWLAARGYHTVYAGVHATNLPSRRAFAQAGFQEIGTVSHLGPYRPKFVPARASRT